MKKVVISGVDSPHRIPMNLQFHSEEGEAAEPSTEPATESAEGDSTEGEKDDSKAFGIRLSQEKAKIEQQYTPIKSIVERQAKLAGMTVEEYVANAEQQAQEDALKKEAEETGKTVDELKLSKEKTEAEKELDTYKRKEALAAEESKLLADEKIGSFVEANLDQIKQIAMDTGTDLQVGLALVVADKLPELLEAADPKKHVEAYLKNLREGTTEPIEIGTSPDIPGGKQLKTFGDALASARERLQKGS